MDAYITKAELRLEPYEVSLEKVDEKYLEVLQELTYELINSWTRQVFVQVGTEEAPVEYRFNGDGSDKLFFNTRLISLNKARIYATEDNISDYDAREYIAVKKQYVQWKKFEVPSLRIINGGGFFPEGVENIGLSGVWGWEAIPAKIKYLQGRLIQKLINDRSFAQKFSSESIGDYSYSAKSGSKFEVTGDFELDSIIRLYRRPINYGTA